MNVSAVCSILMPSTETTVTVAIESRTFPDYILPEVENMLFTLLDLTSCGCRPCGAESETNTGDKRALLEQLDGLRIRKIGTEISAI